MQIKLINNNSLTFWSFFASFSKMKKVAKLTFRSFFSSFSKMKKVAKIGRKVKAIALLFGRFLPLFQK
jgi:hypothetical protein